MKRLLSRVSIAVLLALILLLVTTFALPVMSAQAASTPECWSVHVGISNYQYLNDLDYCDDDAEDIAAELSPVWGSSHVRTLIDSQASKSGILDAISWLASNADADDTVMFTYSGHGASTGYICAYNSSLYSYSNDISISELASALQAIQADKIVVILDMCFAGKFQNSLSTSGRVIMMACASSEYSWEIPSLGHGVYSYYIIQAFNNFNTADTNNDYELSAEEVAQYANDETNDYTSMQNPVLADTYYGQLALLAKFVFNLNMSLPYGTTVLTLDGTNYTSVPGPMLWVPGVSHTITVPQLVMQGNDTRYVFTQWNDGSVSVTRIITKGSYTANYDTEFLLTLISAYGETEGDGWYKDGTWADFSVTDYIELPDTRHYFTGWSGDYSGTTASASTLMNEPKTLTANWRHEYLLTLNSDYGTLRGAGWYDEGATAEFSVTGYIELADTKHYFTGWSGDFTSILNPTAITMSEPKVINANWRHEYLLTINSEYGEPTGAGWYDEGDTASVSVEPVQGVIIRQIFDGWTGDLTDTDPDSSINMNAPKVITATWHTDYMQLYLLIGGVVVLAIIVIVVVILVRRRGGA
jgi:hypothetical protein